MRFHALLSGAAISASCLFSASAPGAPPAEPANIAMVELTGSPAERPGPLDWLMGAEAAPTLRDVVKAIDAAALDANYRVIVVRLKDAELKTTQVEEIGAAMARARAKGKKIHLFSESYDNAGLLLGSYADEVIVQSGGPVSISGVHMEEMFLADTLAWAGVKADMVQVGDYKGAAEQMGRAVPSPQWEENLNGLLDGLYGAMREQMKKGRNLTDAELDGAMSVGWMTEAEQARKLRLVDSVIDLPALHAHMGKAVGGEAVWSANLAKSGGEMSFDASNPFAFFQKLMSAKPPTKPKGPTIAVVHIDGAIIDGDSSSGGMFGGEASVGSRTIRNALEDIASESDIKGVVVRIDSPGGSATASEVIWQGLRRVADKKPVWVSVGSMAASGGYYCAVAGEKIYVNPSSIVGSIGVVGGKLSLGGLYEKLKVNVVEHGRGPRAGLFRSTNPWTPDEIALVRGKMQETYELFTKRVSAGRTGMDLSKTAEGRLFVGEKAVGMKMADKVGGLHECVSDLASSLSMSEYDIMSYPGPKPIEEAISDMFKGVVRAPGMVRSPLAAEVDAAGTALFGRAQWRQVKGSIEALLMLRTEPVVLVGPKTLLFH